MGPFDSPLGESGPQIDFDERRIRYLESLLIRSTLRSSRLDAWRADHPAPEQPVDPHGGHQDRVETICDAVAGAGLERLDPGLDDVRTELAELTPDERTDQLRTWLRQEQDRGRPLARALLARAHPERTEEIFGWSRTGIDRAAYWGPVIYSAHMTYLLETADFGANELIRYLYLLAPVPEHLQDHARRWRDPASFGCDPNFPADGIDGLRRQFTEFKYWMDDPFDCAEFKGEGLRVRSKKAVNGHEDMEEGQDMTYWSENHRILFATAEYLAGQFWPEQFVSMRTLRADPTPRPGDLTGEEHREKAKKRVLRWLDERLRLGFSEWNAPSYYGYDVTPLLNLVDFATDEEVRTRAAMVLDLLVLDMAVNLQGGAFAGSAGRAYAEHKVCTWDQATRDITEVLFGTTGHFTDAYNAAIFLATSPCYRPPDALLLLGSGPPRRFTSRSRVSIGFEEAAEHGVGFSTLDDMEFWWSRAAYATKQTVRGSHKVAADHHLMKTPPFKDILPLIDKFAATIDAAEDVGAGILGGIAGAAVGLAAGGPVGMVAGAVGGAYAGSSIPDFNIEDAADLASVITEGSVLSRANLYTHHDGGASLASVQDFRSGQLNFQGLPCIAALSNGAMVWTTYPSAGSYLDLTIGTGTRVLLGAVVAGPIGIIIGLIMDDIEIHEDIFKVIHDGPTWWTGNVVQPRVVQQGGAAITTYAAQELQKMLFGERTHAWFPKAQFERVLGPEPARCSLDTARWFFGAVGDSYVGLLSARETDWTANGPWGDREIRAEGATNVFITQIGTADQFGSFEAFVAAVTHARVRISDLGGGPSCSYDVPGGQRLVLPFGERATYGGLRLQEDGFPRMQSPFARVSWQQDRYAIQYAGKSVVHDVVAGERLLGGPLDTLDHDTPLTYYAQNMALLPWPLYKGSDRDSALAHLIAVLRVGRPDVVGLSEMWEGDERDTIRAALADVYPHTIQGPHEPLLETPLGDPEIMGGGLLLLSRHPIVVAESTIFRQSSGDDGIANKGVVHARVVPRGHPCPVDVFLTHTQAPEPTVGGSIAEARIAVEAQIRHLGAFVRACRDPAVPTMICGDLNVAYYEHRDLYDYLVATLGPQVVDPQPSIGLEGREHALGTSESDHDDISSFQGEHAPRASEDSERFGSTTDRLDYVFCLPGLLYDQHVASSRVVVEQWSPGRDMSDHYGVEVTIDTTVQHLPVDREVMGLRVVLQAVRCLQTTGGPGADEVSFVLEVRSGGRRNTASTPTYEDVEAGTVIDVQQVVAAVDGHDEVTVLVSGTEDDWIGDDDLGVTVRTFAKDELLALADAGPTLIGCPLLRGDAGEYEVDLLIDVTAEPLESVVKKPR